jgi:hypothetical protein
MSEQLKLWVGEIVLDNLPTILQGALRLIVRLDYPIKDRHSFLAQLEGLSKNQQDPLLSQEMDAISIVRQGLKPLDFPMETPISGLEKAIARFSDAFRLDYGLFIPDPRDTVEHPGFDPWPDYQRMFSPICANRAYEFYRQAIRNSHWAVAFHAGLTEGKRCMGS